MIDVSVNSVTAIADFFWFCDQSTLGVFNYPERSENQDSQVLVNTQQENTV